MFKQSVLSDMSILSRLHKIKELPTLPEVMLKVQTLVNSDEGDANTLANLVRQDPALSSTILRTANSVFYNPVSRRISSISEAVTRLGFKEVQRLTMAMSVIEKFSKTGNAIVYKSFWRHSITAAGLAVEIGRMSKSKYEIDNEQDLYLAGLMHDIGILIFDQFFHDEFMQIIDFAKTSSNSYLQAEGIISPKETHAFIGGALLEFWKLSISVIGAVRYHHAQEKCSEKLRGVVSIISLAEYILCNSVQDSFEGKIDIIDDAIWDYVGISSEELSTLYNKATIEAGKTDVLLSMDTGFASTSDSGNSNYSSLRSI